MALMETIGTLLLLLLALMETIGTLVFPGLISPLTKGGDTRPSLGGDSGLSTDTTGVSDTEECLDRDLGDIDTGSTSTEFSCSTSSEINSSGRVSWSSSSFILEVPLTTSRNLVGSVLVTGSGTPGREGKSLAFMLNSGAGLGGSGL